MSKRAFSRSFDMPTIDPDKEDEIPEIDIKIDGKKNKMSWAEVAKAFKVPESREVRIQGILDDGHVEYKREYNCPVVAKSCDHKWKNYTGLSEQFEYCEICDERK